MSEVFRENPENSKTPEQIESWGERLREGFGDIDPETLAEMEQQVALENIEVAGMPISEPFYQLSEAEKRKFLEVLKGTFGFDEDAEETKPTRSYKQAGVSGTPGEGGATVNVFPTNKEGLFVRIFVYVNNDRTYAFGPETISDES